MRKILIYGFKPLKKYKKNISEETLKRLNRGKFRKVVFPVIPEKKIILNQIKKYQPEIIIGIGQSGKGRIIRIERKAKNIYQEEKSKTKKKINPKGAKQYLVNLKLKKLPGTRISYDAGKYLCNFSMYVLLNFIKKRSLKTKFGFIHIPRNYKIEKAVIKIEKLISQIVGE